MGMDDDLETSTALAFHGIAYVVTVSVRAQTLEIQVEVDERDGAGAEPAACWTARLPAAYVEDLTRKTGNFKRFPVFVNMLLSALAHRSDAVFLDLLTTADLELYRKRKQLGARTPRSHNGSASGIGLTAASTHDSFDGSDAGSSSASSQNANKRYLILTYAVEFDRVHYPLPLTRVDAPTPEILQRTIRRLRQAVTAATRDGRAAQLQDELTTLKEENRCLKSTLESYCVRGVGDEENVDVRNTSRLAAAGRGAAKGGGADDGAPIDLQRELEASMKENKELIGIYQQLRQDSGAEIVRLRAEIKELEMRQDDDGRDRTRELERELQVTRRKLGDSTTAAQEALVQLQRMKNELEESQLKNKELLRQLAIARAKAGMLQNHPVANGSARSTTPNGSATNGSRTGAPARILRRSNSYNRPSHFPVDSDDDEDRRSGLQSPASTKQRRPFRRFDPTAYQEERQRKLEQRSSRALSPSPTRRLANSPLAGYTSDSSAGGYSSAGTDASKSSRGSVRSRGRSRVSYERQREIDARLASPKGKPPKPDPGSTNLGPRSKAPLSRTAPPRGRSPSPARSLNGAAATQQGQPRRDRTPDPTNRPLSKTAASKGGSKTKSIGDTTQKAHRGRAPVALLADTSMDSFSDIDDRLTALQQFLKEAKQGSGNAAVPSAAVN